MLRRRPALLHNQPMSEALKLSSPPGYGPITLFNRIQHAGLAVRPDLDCGWTRSLNIVFLNDVEIARAALDYPIGLVHDTGSGSLVPVAILGLRPQENLFVESDGRWRRFAYVPAYVRRYPFCIVVGPGHNGADKHLICVQEDQLITSPTPLFDQQAEATSAWKPIYELIEAAESGRQRTLKLVQEIQAMELITPFDTVTMSNGVKLRLEGLHRINTQRFDALSGKQLLSLHGAAMSTIYAMMLSIQNIGKLVDLALMNPPTTADK